MAPLLPVYYQIKYKVQDWIVSKEYGPGERIPSENELAKIFNVSRLTIRQAMGLLVQENLLSRKRGEGTFVTSDTKVIESFGLAFSGFMDDLFCQVTKSKTKSVEINKVKATKTIQKKLQIKDEEIVKIERVRMLHNFMFAYTVNYMPLNIGCQLDDKTLLEEPLLKILEVDLGVEFDEAYQTIEASYSDKDISSKLKLPVGSPILYVERIMFGAKKKPIELVQSSYRGDIYKYVVSMKFDRRGKKGRWVSQFVPHK